ncbi:MAG: DUF817 domain-containing protein [Gemmataceae bacterium]
MSRSLFGALAYLADRLWLFGLRQASASVFGGFLLAVILLTKLWYPFTAVARYDALFAAAVLFQVFLLVAGLETLREALIVLVFHLLATAMEVFKTSDAIGSWQYPGVAALKVGNVPLFAGFMYSAVGSYLVRSRRVLDLRFTRYPPTWATVLMAALVYANFFTHHYLWDIRWPLLGFITLLYGRSWVHFRLGHQNRRMPTLVGMLLVSVFIWIAENVATYARIWVYPDQANGWQPVGVSKLLAWFLLIMMSFVLTTLTHPVSRCDPAGRPLTRPRPVPSPA